MPRCCSTRCCSTKRYGKSCIIDMTLMLTAARESHLLLAPTYTWYTLEQPSQSIKLVNETRNKKQNLGQNHAQRPKQESPSERAAQAVNSHVVFAFSHLKVALTTATRHCYYESSQKRPLCAFFRPVFNLHYFPQAVSTACDCVLFRVTAVAQPKCRLTLFLRPRLFVCIHTLRGGSLHDALYCCYLPSRQPRRADTSVLLAHAHTATPYSC